MVLNCSGGGFVGDFVPACTVGSELVAGHGMTACIIGFFVVWRADFAHGFFSSFFVGAQVSSLHSFSCAPPEVFTIGDVVSLGWGEGGNVGDEVGCVDIGLEGGPRSVVSFVWNDTGVEAVDAADCRCPDRCFDA